MGHQTFQIALAFIPLCPRQRLGLLQSQKFREPPLSVAEEELMTITKQDINAVLIRLTEAFPQAFGWNSTSRIGR